MSSPLVPTSESMTIFGVDPGTCRLGFGWIEVETASPENVIARGCGVIEPDAKWPLALRLAAIMEELRAVCAERHPHVLVVEKVFLGKSVTSAFTLGESRGVVLAVAGECGAEIVELSAKTAKKSVTGTGAAEKTDVQRMLGRLLDLDLDGLPLDASDALALAYTGWRRWIANGRAGLSEQTSERPVRSEPEVTP